MITEIQAAGTQDKKTATDFSFFFFCYVWRSPETIAYIVRLTNAAKVHQQLDLVLTSSRLSTRVH